MKKDYTNRALIKGAFAEVCILLISFIQPVRVKDSLQSYFHFKKFKVLWLFSFVAIVGILSLISNSVNAQVTGKVFRDFNSNGSIDSTASYKETGQIGVIVKAYNSAGAEVGTATTDSKGKYTILGVSGPLRIEFSSIPNADFSAVSGGTSVQFVNGGATNVNFGINLPSDYCQTNPYIATTCFVVGDPTAIGYPTNGGPNDALVSTKYSLTSTVNHDAKYSKIGSTWGVSYNRLTKKMFTSAFVKRHAGLGSMGLGGIYVTDYSGGDPATVVPLTTNLINLAPGINLGTIPSNSARGLKAASNVISMDSAAWYGVGKIGLGDIDISDDYNSLFTVNLFSKKVIKIDISNYNKTGVVPTSGQVSSLPDFPNPSCTNGTSRPFALKFYRGKLYLGVVCDASAAGGTRADLRAIVYAFNFTTSIWSVAVAPFPLDYLRGSVHKTSCDYWIPWTDDVTKVVTSQGPNFNGRCFPQPILSDIEFDVDGSMILGFADRGAHMMGSFQPLINDKNTLVNGVNGGDILRVYNNNGTYVLENNGTTLGGGGAGVNNEGPGTGEYYRDNFTDHNNTSLGGLALLAGSGEVITTTIDPTRFESAGFRVNSNTTGQVIRASELYYTPSSVGTFNKGAGLGDIEILCETPPIEIGNRIWFDKDKDGIQDADEKPLKGVSVVLYNTSNIAVDTATTDANGNYYFSSITDPDVKANTQYLIKVVDLGTDGSVAGLALNKVSVAPGETASANTGLSINNNDAFLSGGLPTINYTTGNWGENNHTLDFAIVCNEPTITSIIYTPATCGTNGILNNDAKVTVLGTNINKVNISSASSTAYSGEDYWNSKNTLTFNIPNSGVGIKHFIRLWNTVDCFKDTSFIPTPAPVCTLPKACNAAAGEIGGNVYKDFNNSGTRDSTEKYNGVAGVTVKAYDCDGNIVGTTTTDAFGNYKFTGMPAGKVRIEFGTLLTGLKPASAGVDNGTSTQFVTAPDCTVDFGVNNPNEYCQDNPLVTVPCYIQGPLAGHVLVTFPYNYSADKDGNINGSNTAFPSRTASLSPTSIAENELIGTVYGIAYNPLDKFIYEGAFVKRKAQLGPLSGQSTGAIYRVNAAGGSPTVFADLNTIFGAGTSGANPHPIATANFNDDSPTNPFVFKSGFGDIEISSDFKKLYAVNLKDKTVYVLPTDQKPTAGNIQKLPLNTAGLPTKSGTCPAADVRPFGLGKDRNGDIYLGGACSGETSQSVNDLAFYVWKLNGTSWNLVFKTDSLNYKNNGSPRWNPWKPTQADDAGTTYLGTQHPMGVVSDIEFDGDDMIIGIRDLFGDIVPKANSKPDEDPYPRTGGDIIRACKGGALGFIMENNATCGTNTTAGISPYGTEFNGNSTNGSEYYFGDVSGDAGVESAQGALLNIPGRGEVMSTGFDPVFLLSNGTRPQNNYGTGGMQKYGNKSGDITGAYDVFLSADLNTFGKTAGLGDIEALCDVQPIEIGNRMWVDKDKDGVQDPCEVPIANVKVSLYDKLGNKVGQTTTNANGEYYFNQTNIVDTIGVSKPNILGPQPNTDYFIVFGKEDGSFDKATGTLTLGSGKLPLTVQNSTVNNGNDQNDSDAQTSGIAGLPSALNGYPVIALKTPLSGADHTFDAGFSCTPVITATPKKQKICAGGTASAYTRKIVSGYISSQQWYGPLADTTSSLGTAIAGAVDSTFTPTTLPAAGQTKYYAVIARNGDVSCADTAFVAIFVSPKMILKVIPTNPSCNAGGGSITANVTGGTKPYSYMWSNGASTSAISAVKAGSYTITVTDSTGCSVDTTLAITQPDSITLSLDAMNVSCNTGNNGALMSIVKGGKPGYNYEWNGTTAVGLFYSNDPTVANLLAGTYSLKVTDANGCFKTKSITITQPIAINIAQKLTNNVCFDQKKGEIYVAAGGGVSPYTITWKVNGVVDPSLNGKDTLRNLGTGVYELSLSDANGCKIVENDTISQPSKLLIGFTKFNGTCANGNKGAINSTVSGGNAPYTYAWSNGESTANLSGIPTGNYKLVVIDAKKCKDSITVFIDEQDCRVDVALRKTAEGGCERKAGDLVTFKVVVVRQDTTTQVTTLIVKDQISPDFLVTSSNASKGTFDVSTGYWSGINLAKGDSAILTVVAKINSGASGLLCNQAYVDFMNKIDIDSKAGNLNPVEDDIAYACVSVPINLCKADGQSAILSTPDSLMNIKWFKNGLELTAESGKTSITVSDAGSYTFTGTTNGTNCQVGNCCPVIIKDACFGSIGDYVFDDNNKDGIQNAGDTPIGNVKVYLLSSTGIKLDSTFTDPSGKYLFDSLLTGSYKVQFIAPIGKDFTSLQKGGDPKKDSNAGVNGITSLITIDTTKPASDTLRNNPHIDAGIVPKYGSIGDYVWTDQNNDGQQTAGELPIAGVKVYLYNATGTVKLDSTQTDVNGKYLFDSLLTGSYKVRFIAPAGTIPAKSNVGNDVSDSDVNKTGFSQVININTALTPTDTLRNNPQIDAGFVPVGSLGDYVFFDKNGDGIQNLGDTPIGGIRVYLLNNAGVKLDSTTTDSNGKYLFDSLLANTYKIKFVIPVGSEVTGKTLGGDPTKDSNINPDGTTDAVIIDTTLPVGNIGRDNPTIDAGIKPAYGSIGDYVWFDQNNDGQQGDPLVEKPIQSVKVYLYNASGTVKLDSTQTDVNGKYLFDSLLTGSYKVRFVAPVGTIPAKSNVGNDVSDSDVNKTGFSQVININTALTPTDTLRNNPQIDAGFVPVGSLGDYVFFDKNGDGIQNLGDTPIGGIRVYLLNNAGVKLDSTTTDSNGKYLFDSLLANTYKVKFVIPVGSEVTGKTLGGDPTKDSNINPDGTTDAVIIDTTLPVGNIGRDNPTIDAGIKPAYGSIGDYVWFDANKDGLQTSGEAPVKGVKVYLLNETGTIIDSTRTDINGKYLFDSLVTGSYKIKFVAPKDSNLTVKGTNPLSSTDSNADATTGLTDSVLIDTTKPAGNSARDNRDVDAGIILNLGSIAGKTFDDNDRSASQNAGDIDHPLVKVYLYKEIGGIFVKVDSVITDSQGNYKFNNLKTANYIVQFNKPSGLTFTNSNVGNDTLDSDADIVSGRTGIIPINTNLPDADLGRNSKYNDAGFIPIPVECKIEICVPFTIMKAPK